MVVKRSMKKWYIGVGLILLLLLFGYSAGGETVSMNASGVPNLPLSVDPTGKTEGFSAILYNNPNGLPTSEANAITETGEGFIWIGSYAGLIRYDGNTFERFDSTTGIANVRCLHPAPGVGRTTTGRTCGGGDKLRAAASTSPPQLRTAMTFSHFGHKVRLAPHSCLFYRKICDIVIAEENAE